MLIKQLNQLGEVCQRSGQPVDLVDDNNVDLAGSDLGKKCLQGRTVQRGTGKCPVIIVTIDQAPSLVRLALDVGLTGFALGVERVELKVEVMLGGFSGVDRAPQQFPARLIHGANL